MLTAPLVSSMKEPASLPQKLLELSTRPPVPSPGCCPLLSIAAMILARNPWRLSATYSPKFLRFFADLMEQTHDSILSWVCSDQDVGTYRF